LDTSRQASNQSYREVNINVKSSQVPLLSTNTCFFKICSIDK
jgi:hypothetical protein